MVSGEYLLAWRGQLRVAVVVGDGDRYHGCSAKFVPIRRIHINYVGLVATAMNSIIPQQWTQAQRLTSTVFSVVPVGSICIRFNLAAVSDLLDSGSLVILAGRTNWPFIIAEITTSLRALDIGARVLINEAGIDGVIQCDQQENNAPVKLDVVR